jgi:hypothetical protein
MEFIKTFIESLDLNRQLKDELANQHLLQQHTLYLQLARFLAPAFPIIDSSILDALSGHSYLYFRFLIGLDGLLDKQGGSTSQTTQRLFAYISLHEQAVRGLAQLFPAGDDFWDSFATCKQEYASANLLEKQASAHGKAYTQESFERIAAGKSAVCYTMVYALRSLGKDAGPVSELRQCLEHLHVGMQYLDDVEDFKQDWEQGQLTYTHSLLVEYLSARGLVATELEVQQLHRHLYTSGVAQHLLELGSGHYRRSVDIANALGLKDFADYLKGQLRKCTSYQQDIEWLLLKTKLKAGKSSVLAHAERVEPSPSLLRNSITASISYLRRSCDADGCWTDFMTSAGQSKLWVTAYAGLQLAETKRGLQLAHDAFNASFYLPASYNESILQDGDSTNFAMGLRRKVWGEADASQLETWLAFMDADGGWVTYRDEAQLRKRLELPQHVSVADWMTSKACVTAAAAYVLKMYKELATEYQLTCSYLLTHQHVDGYWESYWWTSPIYATAFAILALGTSPAHAASKARALGWLAAQQMASGAWGTTSAAAQGSAFFTALAIKALLSETGTSYSNSAERGASWLLSNQTTDGSWLTSRILRIPATNVAQPQTVRHWRNSSFGVNVLVDDHNRIFTTSTVLNALSAYSTVQETVTI